MSARLYLASLVGGLLVGVVYGLIKVRSPAPPVIALVGLLGILLGEQAVPLAKRWLQRDADAARHVDDATPRDAVTSSSPEQKT